MAGESDRIDRLELQIKEIRDLLEAGRSRPKVSDIKPEDLQAYVRVRDIIAGDIDDCGINECFRCIGSCHSCRVCATCAVCRACVVECSCGPCGYGGGGLRGNIERFRELGG
jgi:hypothetical protein